MVFDLGPAVNGWNAVAPTAREVPPLLSVLIVPRLMPKLETELLMRVTFRAAEKGLLRETRTVEMLEAIPVVGRTGEKSFRVNEIEQG
jgi:hypothetical protein